MFQNFSGKFFIIAGAVLLLTGLIITFWKSIPLGRLPGDIHIKSSNFSFYFPITTSLLISLILTAVFFLTGKK